MNFLKKAGLVILSINLFAWILISSISTLPNEIAEGTSFVQGTITLINYYSRINAESPLPEENVTIIYLGNSSAPHIIPSDVTKYHFIGERIYLYYYSSYKYAESITRTERIPASGGGYYVTERWIRDELHTGSGYVPITGDDRYYYYSIPSGRGPPRLSHYGVAIFSKNYVNTVFLSILIVGIIFIFNPYRKYVFWERGRREHLMLERQRLAEVQRRKEEEHRRIEEERRRWEEEERQRKERMKQEILDKIDDVTKK